MTAHSLVDDAILQCQFCHNHLPRSKREILDPEAFRCTLCNTVTVLWEGDLESVPQYGDELLDFMAIPDVAERFQALWKIRDGDEKEKAKTPDHYMYNVGYYPRPNAHLVSVWNPNTLLTTREVGEILDVTTDWAARMMQREDISGAQRASTSRPEYKKGRWLVPKGNVDTGLFAYILETTLPKMVSRNENGKDPLERLVEALMETTALLGGHTRFGLPFPSETIDAMIIARFKYKMIEPLLGDDEKSAGYAIPDIKCPPRWYVNALTDDGAELLARFNGDLDAQTVKFQTLLLLTSQGYDLGEIFLLVNSQVADYEDLDLTENLSQDGDYDFDDDDDDNYGYDQYDDSPERRMHEKDGESIFAHDHEDRHLAHPHCQFCLKCIKDSAIEAGGIFRCSSCNTTHIVEGASQDEILARALATDYKDETPQHVIDKFMSLWGMPPSASFDKDYFVESRYETVRSGLVKIYAAWRMNELRTLEESARICALPVTWMQIMVDRDEITGCQKIGEKLMIPSGNRDTGLYPIANPNVARKVSFVATPYERWEYSYDTLGGRDGFVTAWETVVRSLINQSIDLTKMLGNMPGDGLIMPSLELDMLLITKEKHKMFCEIYEIEEGEHFCESISIPKIVASPRCYFFFVDDDDDDEWDDYMSGPNLSAQLHIPGRLSLDIEDFVFSVLVAMDSTEYTRGEFWVIIDGEARRHFLDMEAIKGEMSALMAGRRAWASYNEPGVMDEINKLFRPSDDR